MGFHHLALATRDTKATHEFYSGPMGFELVKVEVGSTPKGGWAKHFFYDTGNGEMIAFWELHDESIPADFPTALSKGMGLPRWVNHIAFAAEDLEDLQRRLKRWLDHGLEVLEIDHGWCQSIYTLDPNGSVVEFCTTTRPFSEADHREALRLLQDPKPELTTAGGASRVHRPAHAQR